MKCYKKKDIKPRIIGDTIYTKDGLHYMKLKHFISIVKNEKEKRNEQINTGKNA